MDPPLFRAMLLGLSVLGDSWAGLRRTLDPLNIGSASCWAF